MPRLLRSALRTLLTLVAFLGAPSGAAIAQPRVHQSTADAWPADAARVRLAVIDLQGREVAVLADGDYAAGRYAAAWDGRGRSGAVPAGLYFVRLSAGGRALVSRVAVVSGR